MILEEPYDPDDPGVLTEDGQVVYSPPLAVYDAMVGAIAECASADEVMELRNKAIGLAAYHRQARNFEAERQVTGIRLRAERRVGELLKELARTDKAEAGAAGGHAKAGTSDDATCQPSPYAAALAENNISRQAASNYLGVERSTGPTTALMSRPPDMLLLIVYLSLYIGFVGLVFGAF